jgi:hypothetical protein
MCCPKTMPHLITLFILRLFIFYPYLTFLFSSISRFCRESLLPTPKLWQACARYRRQYRYTRARTIEGKTMNRRTARGDYWFVTGIIALIALYIHTEELRTPYKDRPNSMVHNTVHGPAHSPGHSAVHSVVASRATNSTILGDTIVSDLEISSTIIS